MQMQHWERTVVPSPEQWGENGKRGLDCGFFTMMAMKRMYAGRDLDFNQVQVSHLYRKLCTVECAALQLYDLDETYPGNFNDRISN